MDSDSWLSWASIVVLFLCAAYFAVAETSMTSVGRIRLKTRLEQGEHRARKALYIQDNFDEAISTILIGTNIVHISTATLVTTLVTEKWGVSFVALGTVLCTLAMFFAGEMLPKSLGKRYSERCALATASSLCFFMRIFAPLARLLSRVGEKFAALSRGDAELTVTEEELYDVIDTLTDEGGLDEERGELVRSALEFADVPVESVLTARVDVAALDVEDSLEEILATIKAQRHSRLPVYEGSIDNVIGVLQIRRFIRAWWKDRENVQLRSLLDEPCFVHQSTPIDELLTELSRRKLNMAIVTDNYGGTLGIVTVEDILEELVGDIWDEDDVASESVKELGDGVYELDAEQSMEDMFEALDYDDPEDEDWNHKLLSEWVYEQFDMLPRVGDSFTWHALTVTVQEMRARRILKLRVALTAAQEGGDGE
ncbi:MAG: HlyC/CorC family transporter [Oscillospiraceae bacterium]|nr:HlyC/CorC family transporter [Oscillospiraceae bacterium]